MGPGVPYAIAAKFAYPDRPAVALVGDGAMQMNGMAELITAAKYYDRWSDPRLVVLVLNNQDLNQVTWEQRAMEGDPKNPMTQRVPDVHYAEFARMIGLDGMRIESPDAIDARLGGGVRRRPAVRDRRRHRSRGAAAAAPHHGRAGEALHEGAARRRPALAALVTESFKQKVLEFLPGR